MKMWQRALVRQTRYKPGWHFELDDHTGDVTVYAYVSDSRHPSQTTTIYAYALAHPSRRETKRRIVSAIRRLEAHEFGEWLRFGSRRPLDPHRRTR